MAEAKTGLMAGKRGLVMGVANDHSIAWGIAQMLAVPGRRNRLHLSGRRPGQAAEAAGRIHRLARSCCRAMSKTTTNSMPCSRS